MKSKGIFLRSLMLIFMVLIAKVGLAQKVTTSLSITANPITGKIADLGIEERGMGYYPISINQSIGQELGAGINVNVKQRWGVGAGFSFRQINKSFEFIALHPLTRFDSTFTSNSFGSFNEKFEVNRTHFSLHARVFFQMKSWQAQLLFGLDRPLGDSPVFPEHIFEFIYTYAIDHTTGLAFNEARRGAALSISTHKQFDTAMTEFYIGKEIKKGLFLNAGLKMNGKNNQQLFEYEVSGNLGEGNGFIYDETDYPLNRTIIKNRIFMYSIGVTYDIPFRDIF